MSPGATLRSRDATDGHRAGVVVIGAVGDQHLEAAGLDDGCGDELDDRLEQGLEVGGEGVRLLAGSALFRHRIDHRRLELVGVLGELQEQVVDLVEGGLGESAFLRSTLLITTMIRSPTSKALRRTNRPCRGIGSLGRIDQEQATIGHVEHSFHLAAEVGVSRRVDDIDGHLAVADRGVLGQDRDALLSLEVVGIHD